MGRFFFLRLLELAVLFNALVRPHAGCKLSQDFLGLLFALIGPHAGLELGNPIIFAVMPRTARSDKRNL